MKKYFAMLAVLLNTVTMSALYYVGGDFGFTSSNNLGFQKGYAQWGHLVCLT